MSKVKPFNRAPYVALEFVLGIVWILAFVAVYHGFQRIVPAILADLVILAAGSRALSIIRRDASAAKKRHYANQLKN